MASIQAKALIQAMKRGGLLDTPINADNLQEKRQQFKKMAKYFPKPRWAKITPVKTDLFRGEWVSAPNSNEAKALLYFHGGGFVLDNIKVYRDLIARLAKASGMKVFLLDYSLAPEHPYPAAFNEAFASYQWLLEQGYKPEDIAVGGDSAGGALALSMLHKIREQKIAMPTCVFVMSPPTDATMEKMSLNNSDKDFCLNLDTLQFFTESYFGDASRKDPFISPFHGSLKGFPPLLMHIDKDEVMYNDTVRFAAKARKEGVEVELYESEGLFHVWHAFARYIPEAKKSIVDIGNFVKKYIKSA